MQVLTVVVGLLGALMSTVKAAAVDTTAAAINTTTTAPLRICATYYSDGAFDQLPAYANGHYENAEDFAHITSFWNLDCGFCIVFEGRDCTGPDVWWGGPSGYSGEIRGQSYFCY